MEILTLGEKIRIRRKELNMTLKDLAGDRVTAGQLSFVELGKSNPSPELLEYIAERLSIGVDYLQESEVSQARGICDYNIRIAQAYIYDRNDDDAHEILDESDMMAKKYNLGDLIGKIELNRGKIDLHIDEYESAVQHFLKANEYFIEYHDIRGTINTYIMLGQTASKRQTYDLALSYFKQAAELNQGSESFDEKLNAKIHFDICLCYSKIGTIEQVDKHLKPIEEYLGIVNDKREYAHRLMALSLSYKNVRNYEKALYYADRAVTLFGESEDNECMTKMEMNIGLIYAEKGDIDKSDYFLFDSEKRLGNSDTISLARVYLSLARNEIKRNVLKDTKKYIESSFNIAVDMDDKDCQIDCYSCLYDFYFLNNDYANCEKALKDKLSLVESIGKTKELIGCYIELGKYYDIIGDKNSREKYMEKGYDLLSAYNSKMKLTV